MRIAPTLMLLGALVGASASPLFALNGALDDKGQFPFVVQIVIQKSEKKKGGCSGTIHTRRMVVTAAHCFYDEKTDTVNDSRVTVRFKDEHGIVRYTRAKVYLPDDYIDAARHEAEAAATLIATDQEDKKWDALSHRLTDAQYRAFALDLAILLTTEDIDAPTVPATLLDESLPFAPLVKEFHDPKQEWSQERIDEALRLWREEFGPHIPAVTEQLADGETGTFWIARGVGYGKTCTEDKPECDGHGLRRHGIMHLGPEWGFLDEDKKFVGFLYRLFKPDVKVPVVIAPGDSGGPLGVEDTVTGKFTQIGVNVGTKNILPNVAFYSMASTLIYHAGELQKFLSSAEYRAAMNKRRQAPVLQVDERPLPGTPQYGALAVGVLKKENLFAIGHGLGNTPESAEAIALARCGDFCTIMQNFGAFGGARCAYITGVGIKGRVDWIFGDSERDVKKICKKRRLTCIEPVGGCAW